MAEEEMEVKTETNEETEDGDATATAEAEEAAKTEEELEQELQETQISIPRYAPHTVPEWQLDDMRERWKWHVRIFPIDQEDCRNCILDAATKISQEAWYYVPKRKNGQGVAELCMSSHNEAAAVMSRVVRMPFYHRFVTIEVTRRGPEEGEAPFTEITETATVVFDSTKCEKIKNTATSRGNQKRRSLWVRYLSENTSTEILRVLFPLSQSTQVETHDNLRLGVVECHSKTDVLIFMKSYLTVLINDTHILALQNTEPGETESETKAELEKNVTGYTDLEGAPTEVADRSEQRKDDKTQTSRVLKRTLHQQQRILDGRKGGQGGKRGRGGEPPAKRGGGNWGDRGYDRRRDGGGRYGGGGGFGGRGGGGGGFPRGGPQFGGGADMAAEMMMMQAQLNQTIQNQLMMLNPEGGPGGPGGYGGGGGRFGGGGGGGGRRGGGRGGGGRRW